MFINYIKYAVHAAMYPPSRFCSSSTPAPCKVDITVFSAFRSKTLPTRLNPDNVIFL